MVREAIGGQNYEDQDQPSGHVYTAEEVRMRLARLEQGMKDLGVLRRPFSSGVSGFSGIPGLPGLSGFSGRSASSDPHRIYEAVRYEQNPYADFHEEGFMAKGIRELKEYFQALFVKTLNKKEIEHG